MDLQLLRSFLELKANLVQLYITLDQDFFLRRKIQLAKTKWRTKSWIFRGISFFRQIEILFVLIWVEMTLPSTNFPEKIEERNCAGAWHQAAHRAGDCNNWSKKYKRRIFLYQFESFNIFSYWFCFINFIYKETVSILQDLPMIQQVEIVFWEFAKYRYFDGKQMWVDPIWSPELVPQKQ